VILKVLADNWLQTCEGVIMNRTKELAVQLFSLDEKVISRSGGNHEISLQSEIDRSLLTDRLPRQLENLSEYIDHTILKTEATDQDIIKLCQEAEENRFKAVCINPCFLELAKKHLKTVELCTVAGFPLGANTTAVKARETELALQSGATEVDMVINLGALKSGRYQDVAREISLLAGLCREKNAILKVIIETCYLTADEKIIACLLSKKSGADYVKTSTGFGSGGATVADIILMRGVVGPKMGVKASGGIKTREEAINLLKAGANRLGTSRGLCLIEEEK